MNNIFIGAIVCLIFPAALHVGILKAASFHPPRLTGKALIDKTMKKWIVPIILANGFLMSFTFFVFHVVPGKLWIVPLLIMAPLLVLQISYLMMAKYQFALNSKSRGFDTK